MDFGSTFTKAALVEVPSGALVATADHRTTIDTDVLDGWDACRAALAAADPRADDAEVLACSSAGGGLRIAVVGNEELVTAEAGRRVALSSGGRVVHVTHGGLARADVTTLRATKPDVLLLVGGTDGGNEEVLVGCATTLARARWRGPVVVAGNVDAQAEVAALLTGSGTPHVLADNVVPRIGVLAPESARAAIREMFLRHVIGGKHLSRRDSGERFTAMVRGATPDVVLTAVELLADELGSDVVVVDVGGATTDVHSVVEVDPEDAGLSRQVVATVPVSRTVEGDLGMRWSAISTVEEGVAAGLLDPALADAAAVRQADPSYLPGDALGADADLAIAAAAVTVALRRHAGRSQVVFSPEGRVVERSGKDLREVDLLVGSGGVLRHSDSPADGVLTRHLAADPGAGWQLPEHPRTVVDRDYVLAPVGLLAAAYPEAARSLARRLLRP
ncbi:glutamate mutase [Nocardioides iriomotensis]|uniref:Glutamate mutase n=1 Tax=Nocardioides iriomotensis TaxID=715784 RepID=A0A4Q5J8E4_9ACTN|nr:glutamate mutase [Nocardioides iriomotensis]